ncbi:MAG TPA: branched-chain amino acid ABC transporter permease [Kofleriaceae bacterium]
MTVSLGVISRGRLAIAIAVTALCVAVPLVIQQDYQLNILFRVFLFAAMGLAWNLVGGYTGQLSLGHAAFFGIGAYGLAIFHGKLGLPVPLALVAGVATATLAAAGIGRVAFRLRGPYFALATIAFAEVLRLTAKNLPAITGGDVGLQVPMMFESSPGRMFYWAAVALAAAAFAITVWVTRSRFGYALLAIREDEDTALACGIDTTRTKLVALLISAALTALGGALYASLFLFIVPDQVFGIDISNEIAIAAMLGGAGTWIGPILGSVLLELALESFKNQFQEAHLIIYGALIVLVVMVLPEGIVGGATGLWRKYGGGRR